MIEELFESLSADKRAIVKSLKDKESISREDYRKIDAKMIHILLAHMVDEYDDEKKEKVKSEWKRLARERVDVEAFYKELNDSENAEKHKGETRKLSVFELRKWFEVKYCEWLECDKFPIRKKKADDPMSFVDFWD